MKKYLIFSFMAVILIACETETTNDDETNTSEATSIELVSGDNQTALPGETLTESIIVKVKDEKAYPFKGANVTFDVTEGSVSHNSVISDEDGIASITWTLGASAGEQVLTITSFKPDGINALNGSPIKVKAEAVPLCVDYDVSADFSCPDDVDAVITFCSDTTNNIYYYVLWGVRYDCSGAEGDDCNEALNYIA